jgi:hypothetical protein
VQAKNSMVFAIHRKEFSMNDHYVFNRFPEGSMNVDYELFEEFADGSTLWRASVFGMKAVESKLRELARRSENKFFALCVKDQKCSVIRP